MKSPLDTYNDSLRNSRAEIIDALKHQTPMVVATQLEQSGWHREWACLAVETMELKYNPAGLFPNPQASQKTREKLQSRGGLGAALFFVGLVVSVGTLWVAVSAGGLVIIAYGAVIWGAATWLGSYSKLKQHPDRPIPKYVPPRKKGVHDPGNY
jgi:hypothetical protein